MKLNENIDRIKNLMGIKNSYQDNIINEAITDIVYHYTDLFNLKNILETNKFYTRFTYFFSPAYTKSRERNFYFSTTRNKTQIISDFSSKRVRIKLDGRKLNQKYKGGAIDYFGGRNKSSNKSPNQTEHEFEDRIMLNEPYIENALNYILDISIRYDDAEAPSKYEPTIKENISKVIKLCEEKNIPFAIYKTQKDFIYEKNPIFSIKNIDKNETTETNYNYEYKPSHLLIISFILFKNETPIKTMFPKLTESDIEQINKNLNFIENHRNLFDSDYLLLSISDIGQEFRLISKDVMYKLMKDMKKYNTKDIKEYIKIKLELNGSK